MGGIDDPMSLPSMHILLDMVERLILESMQGSKDPKADENKRNAFLDRLYQPDPQEFLDAITSKTTGSGHKPPPPGFSEEETEAAFDQHIGAEMG